ncbi:MAG TPA: glycosyltransferase family 1 protein, partial [Thermomicrobiales bacterium]|nr:glycosyltransferase family 1 protein [Thermomicrobiales bacterium]
RLLGAMPPVLDADELVVFAGRQVDPLSAALAPVWRRVRVPTERPEMRLVWEHLLLPVASRRARVDLVHGPVNVIPRGLPGPSVVTIHDLAFLQWPEQIPRRRYRYLARELSASAKRATRILAVSEATKRDIVDQLGIDPGKIVCTPLGVDARFQPVSGDALNEFRAARGLDRPYILSVATLEPRKNLPRLLDAYAIVAERLPHDLVLVGPEGWLTTTIHERLQRPALADRVRVTGFVPDAELPAWYSGAELFAYPSLYEGFGLPPLEAMACGTPVLTSTSSSLPEVVGDAAIVVDPTETEAIAEGLLRGLTDQTLTDELRRRGPRRAARFTWERTAALTVAAYREAV